MQEEDYEVLRNEANANPEIYRNWDQNRQFRQEYAQLHANDPTYEERTRQGTIDRHDRTTSEPAHPASQAAAAPLAAKEEERKEEEVAPLSPTSTNTSSSSASSRSRRLDQIRTAHSTATSHDRRTSDGNILHLHPTERHPEAIARIETHRSQHRSTVGAAAVESRLTRTLSRRKPEKPLPSLGAGKPFPPQLPDREEYVVEFDGADDPLHAQNWPMKKKLGIGAILAFDALTATMGSAIFSAGTREISKQFHVIQEVGTLGTSLFVFGYAFGPLVSTSFLSTPSNQFLVHMLTMHRSGHPSPNYMGANCPSS